MTAYDDRPNRIPWPPLLYSAAILASVLFGWFFPHGWLPRPFSDVLFAAGWLLIAGGLALDLAAMVTLNKASTTIWPNRGVDHLVSSGPFAISRNPIYLGNTTLMIGVGLAAGIAWFILFALVAAYATQKLAIEREEKHLEHRFGKRYRDYMKKVRRWF